MAERSFWPVTRARRWLDSLSGEERRAAEMRLLLAAVWPTRVERVAGALAGLLWRVSGSGLFGWLGDRFDDVAPALRARRVRRQMGVGVRDRVWKAVAVALFVAACASPLVAVAVLWAVAR